ILLMAKAPSLRCLWLDAIAARGDSGQERDGPEREPQQGPNPTTMTAPSVPTARRLAHTEAGRAPGPDRVNWTARTLARDSGGERPRAEALRARYRVSHRQDRDGGEYGPRAPFWSASTR